MRVAKWGNSLAIRLPSDLVEALNLREGDDIQVVAANERAIAVKSSPKFLDLIEKLRSQGKLLPRDYRFTRADAYEGSGRD